MRSTRRRLGALGVAVSVVATALVALDARAEPAAAAATIRVPADHATIQAAVDAADDGDIVLVSPGTYHERVDLGGKDVVLRSGAGPETTTIHGPGGSVVLMGPGGRLEGFTITGGGGEQGWAVVPGDGSVVRGNRFVGNRAVTGSGPSSIAIDGRSPVIDRNLFHDNDCDGQFTGGVISIGGPSGRPSSARITNNVFTDNLCRAAINVYGGSTGPTGILIANNTVTRGQTGIEVYAITGEVVIRNNLVTDNEVGYVFRYTEAPVFDHNFVGSNRMNSGEGTPNLLGIDGNLTGDPEVVDASSNYEPRAGSPLVDNGSATGAPAVDFDGDPRPSGAGVDIGAFERDGTEPAPPTTGGRDATWGDGGIGSMGSRYQVALASLPSGGLYAGSWRDSDGGPMRITRFDPDGTLDEGYGLGGFQRRAFTPDGRGESVPHQVAVAGGRVVVIGEAVTSGGRTRVGVARLTSTGAYDPTFSGDGRVLYRIFARDHDLLEPFHVAVHPDGRTSVAVAAYDRNAKGAYAYVGQAVFRLRADGSLDPTLYGDGREVVPDDWSDVAFLPNGAFYAGRRVGTVHEVRKRLPSGGPDRSFSGDGRAAVDCGDHLGVVLGVDPAGRPVLVCVGLRDLEPLYRREHREIVFTMFRFTTAGGLDPGWSGDGRSRLVLDDWLNIEFRPDSEARPRPWLLTIDVQGRPWIVTAAPPVNVADGRMLEIYRIGTGGELDPSWSRDGVQRDLLPFTVDVNAASVDGDRLITGLQRSPAVVALVAHTS